MNLKKEIMIEEKKLILEEVLADLPADDEPVLCTSGKVKDVIRAADKNGERNV